MWDINVAQGGPIKKDKLWFFASFRDWGVYQYIANSFFRYGDQAGQQTIDDARISSAVARLTGRVGDKNKVAGYLDRIRKFRGHENSAPAGYAIAGEATDIRAPKQVLHQRDQVHRHAHQQVPRRGRLRDQQRELLADAAGSDHSAPARSRAAERRPTRW